MKTSQKLVIFLALLASVTGRRVSFDKGKIIVPQLFVLQIKLFNVVSAFNRQDATGATSAMLDAMEQLMTGGTEFDPAYEARLYTCMDKINPLMRDIAVSSVFIQLFSFKLVFGTFILGSWMGWLDPVL